ncbi:MAG TPA: hypothetical protein VFQ61_34050 [Polyangiaceae bacterium]|nr:hypothetical protein [Polyangiaceae bacterium]
MPASCHDARIDAGETDVDCGGETLCERCEEMRSCRVDADCVAHYCSQGACLSPHCDDGRLNADESDVDCGGDSACARCLDAQACLQDGDCASRHCAEGACISGTCFDGAANSLESDVDCGGANACPRCADGLACADDTDCSSATCAGGRCVPASCHDASSNNGETGVDCGGVTLCSRCPVGSSCETGADCASGHCVRGACVPENCDDGRVDGAESDLDCGGETCAPCADGAICRRDSDCQSRHCYAGSCGTSQSCDYPAERGRNPRKVRLVYMVPADRAVEPQYIASLERGIRHLQAFTATQLLNGQTFSLGELIVTTVQSSHDSAWFNTPRADSALRWSFYRNVLDDGRALVSAKNDGNQLWLFFPDVLPTCDSELGSVDRYFGVASMNALRGLSGLAPLPNCGGDPVPAAGTCQSIGDLNGLLAQALEIAPAESADYPSPFPSALVSAYDHSPFFAPEYFAAAPCECADW